MGLPESSSGKEDNTLTPRYHIDMAWLREHKRSFASVAASRLCGQGHEELRTSSVGAEGVEKLWETFQQCCSQQEGFISANQPLTESLFRLFLAVANQPLTVGEIGQHLRGWRGEKVPQPQVLEALLDKDAFYGFRRLPEDASD